MCHPLVILYKLVTSPNLTQKAIIIHLRRKYNFLKKFVEKYDKKREIIETNGVDIGYFIVSKKSLDPNLTGNISFELDILPLFIARNELSAYITDNQYYFITNMQTLHDFEKAVVANNFLPLPRKYFEL